MKVRRVSKAIVTPEKRRVSVSTMVMIVVVMSIGFFFLGTKAYLLPGAFSKVGTPSELDFSSLNELYQVLRSKYDGQIEASKLIDGAKHGMIDAVGDPHTVYLTADEAKEVSNDLNGTFEGIGAELGKVDGRLTVMGVIGDSPAQKVGLQTKDIIYKVNDEDITKLTVTQAVMKIRGPKGTSVSLSILRGDEVKELSIKRETITNPSVTHEVLDGDVGYIRITRFGEDTVLLARQAANDLKNKNVRGVILDLRDNAGGLLSASQGVASLWLKNKPIVSQRTGGIATNTLNSEGLPVLEGVKTVVLVNSNSASASEIVAGALKDYGAATLLGEKTYGKGSVQSIERLSGGSELKVTIAKWYTPKGKNIDKEGIQPDKVVSIPENNPAGTDPQKDAALKEI